MAERHYPKAKIMRAVDGDTIDLMVDVGFYSFAQVRIRLAGLNCPEINTPEGRGAKLFCESWFTRHGGECALTSHGKDKYGRWVGTIESVTDKNDTLNGALLANSYAVPYEG